MTRRHHGLRHALLACLALACALPCLARERNQQPGTAVDDRSQPGSAGLAERRLGQGIAYFHDGRYAQSLSTLREALSLRLARPEDEAIAHEYLAFFYCMHDSVDLCEDEFRMALSGPTPVQLSAAERDNPAWRDTYARVKAQLQNGTSGSYARGRFGGRIEEYSEKEALVIPAGQIVSWQQARDRTAAQLRLAIEPWGDVYVNQQKVATSPPIKELRLEPGIYTIEVRNAELPAFVQTVTLKSRESYRLVYQFDTRQ